MRISSYAAGVACLLVFGSTARAENAWYVSGSVGGHFEEDANGPETFFKTSNRSITATGTNRTDYDPGAGVNAAIGYRLSKHFRLEAELGYAEYSVSNAHPFTTDPNFPRLNGATFSRRSGGGVSLVTSTINAFVDINPLVGRYTPYFGAGAGEAYDDASTSHLASRTGVPFTGVGGHYTTGVAFAEAGVSVPLGKRLIISPAYRHLEFFGSSSARRNQAADVVKLGLRYGF
jgi:hypothetical protein